VLTLGREGLSEKEILRLVEAELFYPALVEKAR